MCIYIYIKRGRGKRLVVESPYERLLGRIVASSENGISIIK